MKYSVEITRTGQTRHVEVPDAKVSRSPFANLEQIFYYGQNEIQPLPMPSVSVGDVITLDGFRYRVDVIGFNPLVGEVRS